MTSCMVSGLGLLPSPPPPLWYPPPPPRPPFQGCLGLGFDGAMFPLTLASFRHAGQLPMPDMA